MDIEFLSPHSLDECAYYLREWMLLKNQSNGYGLEFDIASTDEETFEFAIHSKELLLPVLMPRKYFGFGIVGIMRRQDAHTTIIKARTRVSVHPIFLLHAVLFYYPLARQLLIQFRDVFINPHIGGSCGYAPIHRDSKSKQTRPFDF